MKTIKKDINNSILLLIDDVNKLYFFRVEDMNQTDKNGALKHTGEHYKEFALREYLRGKVGQFQEYHQRVVAHLVKYSSTIRQITVEENLDPDIKIARAHTKPARRHMGKLLQALGYKNMGSADIELDKVA